MRERNCDSPIPTRVATLGATFATKKYNWNLRMNACEEMTDAPVAAAPRTAIHRG